METTIEDLLAIIHLTIIKNDGENTKVLDELRSITEKIKSGELTNYAVNNNSFFQYILRKANT